MCKNHSYQDNLATDGHIMQAAPIKNCNHSVEGVDDTAHCHAGDTAHYHTDDQDKFTDHTNALIEKHWQIIGMDCASCARKIENVLQKLTEVQQAKVSFTTERLSVKMTQDITAKVVATITEIGFTLRTDPATTERPTTNQSDPKKRTLILLLILMCISWLSTLINKPLSEVLFTATTLIGWAPIANRAYRLVRSGQYFPIEVLMSIATLGALLIRANEEAAMVILLFILGEYLEAYAAKRARKGIKSLTNLIPEQALLLHEGKRTLVETASLKPGDYIEVPVGGRLPIDGTLISPLAQIDESALTGESVPIEHYTGDKLSAGCLVVDMAVEVCVTSSAGDNTIDRIINMIEQAEEKRAPVERLLDRISRIYTPIMIIISILTIIVPPLLFAQAWLTWIYRGLALLLIGCPCALIISTPAAITSALASAARQGILIKGGAALEQLAKVSMIAFDKTGTLTQGQLRVTDVIPVGGGSKTELIKLSAAVEMGATHPLAKAIVAYAEELKLDPAYVIATDRKTLIGMGIEGVVAGNKISLCTPDKTEAVWKNTEYQQSIEALQCVGKTVVVVQCNHSLIGLLGLKDTLREEAQATLSTLSQLGIKGVMLTGDNHRTATTIAHQLEIDYYAQLLPEDKLKRIEELNKTFTVAMVGDGINDAPAMKMAEIGIAMGQGTDVALETAQVALVNNNLAGLTKLIKIARNTHTNIKQNITIALGLKGVFLITSLLGITGLWLAVLADSGATALVTLNALRLLRLDK